MFISHAGPDSASALLIADGLEKCGIHARVDQVEVRAGTNIVMWMNAAVTESDPAPRDLVVLARPAAH